MFLLRNNGDVCVQHVRGEPEKEQSGGALQVSSHKGSFSLGGGAAGEKGFAKQSEYITGE